jgi:hypothetical protein
MSKDSNTRRNFMSNLISRGRAGILATLVLVASCADLTAPLQSEGKPSALEFSIGGFFAASRQLELRGDTLVARRRQAGWQPGGTLDSVRVVPSAEAWRAFWDAADAAGLQKWHPEYNAEGVQDGLAWSIRVVGGGREINAGGSNAYPDRDGKQHELDQPREFEEFLHALNVLVGVTNWF